MSRAIAVATGVAGLVAYVYLLGGIVTWLHLTTAQLPGDTGTIAISSRQLLTVGCRVAAFEILLLAAVSALVTFLVGLAIFRRGELPAPPQRDFQTLAESWGHLWTLGGMIAPGLAWLVIVLGLSVERASCRWILLGVGGVAGITVAVVMVLRAPRVVDGVEQIPRWRGKITEVGDLIRDGGHMPWVQRAALATLLLNGAVAVVAIPVLQGAILLAGTAVIYAGAFLRWPSSSELEKFRGELVRSSGVWVGIGAATLVALAWVATPPVSFTRAIVPRAHGNPIPGAFLDRNDEGVFLGKCRISAAGSSHPRSVESRIEFVPAEATTGLTLGGYEYVFDPGGRPSLAQVIGAGVGGGSVADDDAPIHHSLRGRAEHVCADP